MASLGTIMLTGKSKTQHEFNIYARSQKFNAIGAIYVMAKKSQNANSYDLIYIGQTGDASERPFNHHRKDCFDKNRADHVFICSEGSEKRRFEIETDLIQNYNTQCNKQ
jgi:hypothetical protein